MISSFQINNLGPVGELTWAPGRGMNVLLGRNATGKTLLLKALYATQRSLEEYKRGADPRTFKEVLDHKLYWTFQVPRLGTLVHRGADRLRVAVTSDNAEGPTQLRYSFTRKAERGVGRVEGEPKRGRDAESIFVPGKEVVSLVPVIKESRDQQKFGFDDPTLDLVRALEREPSRGRPPFGPARNLIEKQLLGNGRLQLERGAWVYRTGQTVIPVAIAAEGHKKIGILDRLIVNRTLSADSLLFFDEPESFLHPRALVDFLRILAHLAEAGVQIFMATHSLFVLNTLRVYATATHASVPVLSLADDSPPARASDLRDEMPDNPIIDTSIQLYEMEIDGAFDD